jgi:protein gp37
MTSRFAGDVRLNMMAKKDYKMVPAADGGKDLYVLDAPMMNETGNPLVYPFDFEPTLHRYRMDIPKKLKMGNNIFVGAMSDIFGEWVPDEWISEVMTVCRENTIHNYLFLTKNPERYQRLNLPDEQNMWYGTSITNEADIDRLNYLPTGHKTFVSIEPLLADIKAQDYGNMFKDKVDWIIIGAETGRSKGKVVPSFEWIKDIVLMADEAEIPVFMKESLVPIVGEVRMRRAYPKQLQHSEISPKMKRKLYDTCSECKAHLKKSEMITLLARSKRGEQPKQFGFMCRDCFKKFCKELGLEVPALAEFADSITIGPGDDTDG